MDCRLRSPPLRRPQEPLTEHVGTFVLSPDKRAYGPVTPESSAIPSLKGVTEGLLVFREQTRNHRDLDDRLLLQCQLKVTNLDDQQPATVLAGSWVELGT